jgi:hypothetical protein
MGKAGSVCHVSILTTLMFNRQGCSKAIIGAVTLNTVLRAHSQDSSESLPANFSKLFFETQAAKTDSIWYGLHRHILRLVTDVDTGREQRLLVRLVNFFHLDNHGLIT